MKKVLDNIYLNMILWLGNVWVDVRTAKGPVLKTGEIARCLGSNPSPPAIQVE